MGYPSFDSQKRADTVKFVNTYIDDKTGRIKTPYEVSNDAAALEEAKL